jgi:hypothetical protein
MYCAGGTRGICQEPPENQAFSVVFPLFSCNTAIIACSEPHNFYTISTATAP